jgi:hypothetical protein
MQPIAGSRSSTPERSAAVNGAVVQEEGPPPKGLVAAPDQRVGFGGYIDENLVSMRFRNVEIRRLPAGS